MTSDLATAVAVERERRKRRAARMPLMDYIGQSPGNISPFHLAPLVDALEAAGRRERVRHIFSVPPQHGKSEAVLHALVQALIRDPTGRHAFATYAGDFAGEQERRAQRIASHARLSLQSRSGGRWITPEGGGVVWTSRKGGVTGRPVDGMFILDDLLKNRIEARSPATKSEAMDFIRSSVLTRLHPGASVILIATRWAIDDPSGRLAKEGWQMTNLPAIDDHGEALWPEMRPVDYLEAQRQDMTAWDFDALYMGRPRPFGSAVFSEPRWYDPAELPSTGYRQAHGFDAAYTAATSADYSVTVTGRAVGDKLYITGMLRDQLEATRYIAKMKAHGIGEVTWMLSGTEKGLVSFLRNQGIKVRTVPVVGDKYVRAQPVAAAWQHGRVLLPNAPEDERHRYAWVDEIVDEVEVFTGDGDEHDDIVDALAALWHALFGKRVDTDVGLVGVGSSSLWTGG